MATGNAGEEMEGKEKEEYGGLVAPQKKNDGTQVWFTANPHK